MKGLLCLILGHDFKTKWDVEFAPAFGRVEVEKAECQRCDYCVPTGRDKPKPLSG